MWIARVSCPEGRCSFYPVDLSLATDQSINRPDRSGIPHGILTLIMFAALEKADRDRPKSNNHIAVGRTTVKLHSQLVLLYSTPFPPGRPSALEFPRWPTERTIFLRQDRGGGGGADLLFPGTENFPFPVRRVSVGPVLAA